MTDDKDKQDFEDYLKGDSELSRHYRDASKQQPAKHLDEAILNAAREEVAKKPGTVVTPFTRNWYVPVSIAAVLVLSISLVFNIYQDAGHDLLTTPQPVTEDEQLPDLDGRMDTEIPARKLKRSEAVDSPKTKIQSEIATQEHRQADELLKQPAIDIQNIPSTAPMDKITSDKKDAGIKSRAAKPEEIEMIWQQNKRLETEPETKATESLGESLEEKEVRKNITAERPVATGEEDIKEEMDAGAAKKIQLEDSIMQSSDDDSSQFNRSKSREDFLGVTPDQWLEEISKLWQLGNKDEAIENLKQFFQVYPDYSLESARTILPDDLNIPDYVD